MFDEHGHEMTVNVKADDRHKLRRCGGDFRSVLVAAASGGACLHRFLCRASYHALVLTVCVAAVPWSLSLCPLLVPLSSCIRHRFLAPVVAAAHSLTPAC